ncbi:hypothetical protein GQ600_17694 [Phytophthora cactorum]|nr:hypothetical protein GQ600_17694 [Phytophthora cactorum]
MQWLRTFVYEMTGTHTEADKWCIPFELSLRTEPSTGSATSKKTKRTWKLEAMRSSAITARSLPRLLCPATTRRNVNEANTSATT